MTTTTDAHHDCDCRPRWRSCAHDFQRAAEAAGRRAAEDEPHRLRAAEDAGRFEAQAREDAARCDRAAIERGESANPLVRDHATHGHAVAIAGCPACTI